MKPYLRYIFGLALDQKKRVMAMLLLVFLSTMARLGQPYLFKIMVDVLTAGLVVGFFGATELQFLLFIVIGWFILTVFSTFASAQSQYLVWELGNKSSQKVHVDGYRRLLRLDYQEHKKRHSSYYAETVDDADTSMWEMTNWWFNRFIPGIIGFVGMLVIAFTVSWQMTLVSLTVIPPGLFIVIRLIAKNEARQHFVNKLWKRKHEHLSDQLSNIAVYKLNPNEAHFVDVQSDYAYKASHEQSALNKQWRLAEMVNPDIVARFLVIGMGVYFVAHGQITLGTLFMFFGLLNEILTPLHLLGDILPQYSRRARYIERFLQLMEQKDAIKDAPQAVSLPRAKGKIEFRNVTFSYQEEEKSFTLKKISFIVQPGQHIAFVGHSGAGKSTMMSLLTRLMDPTQGMILLDDVDLRLLKMEDLLKQIGTVLQDTALYNETIAQNIAYGDLDATRDEIIAASQKAAAHDFIMKLSKGYDTLIGERGVRLSGGEKQRVAIARAILKNPAIVVLDEPTSALDSITEKKVEQGLHSLMQGRTAIIIAHRLATVRHADVIMVIEEGGILAQGTHAELLKKCPVYKEMVELQTGGFLAE